MLGVQEALHSSATAATLAHDKPQQLWKWKSKAVGAREFLDLRKLFGKTRPDHSPPRAEPLMQSEIQFEQLRSNRHVRTESISADNGLIQSTVRVTKGVPSGQINCSIQLTKSFPDLKLRIGAHLTKLSRRGGDPLNLFQTR